MPVSLHRDPSGHELLKRTNGLLGKSAVEFKDPSAGCLDIGVLNNMPDAALQSTERQFLTLIDGAASEIMVRVTFYALPDIPRSESGKRHIGNFYSGIERLWDGHLDGLIITGTEPRASNLIDEPYWHSLTGVFEWAGQNTRSTIFSCLGAHAAVLHFDGIDRQRLGDKRFGLFDSHLVADHRLTACTPLSFPMPHSRWNGVSEKELSRCGYRILARGGDGSVDIFVKQEKSLFVFLQGHPEYETNTLLLEYRRDVGRYLRQEADTYPSMPQGYFDAHTASILTALSERALCDRREALIADFPSARLESRIANSWRPAAASIYANWLTYLCGQKKAQASPVYHLKSA